MDLSKLSPELKARALECTSPEELADLAKEEGIELTDEQLESVAGGTDWSCPLKDCSNNKGW